MLLIAGACGSPNLHHLDGRPFYPSAPLATFENGWVAVDSCSVGVHALLDLRLDVAAEDRLPPYLGEILLQLTPYHAQQPEAVTIEGPFCAHTPRLDPSQTNQSVPAPGESGRSDCTYVIRAEFRLDQLPIPGDTMRLLINRNKLVRLRWR